MIWTNVTLIGSHRSCSECSRLLPDDGSVVLQSKNDPTQIVCGTDCARLVLERGRELMRSVGLKPQ